MIKVIVFDFFGVLGTPMYGGVIKKHFEEAKWHKWFDSLEKDLDMGIVSEADFNLAVSKEANVAPEVIQKEAYDFSTVNAELFSLILKLKNKYNVGLLTNAPRSMIENVLGNKLELFNTVIISSDVQMVKPDVRIFKYLLEKTQCNPDEIIFIDDSQKNIDTATQLGIKGIVFKDNAQVYGALAEFGV